MTKDQVRELIAGVNVWKRGGHRAPHKPLLLLASIARASRGEPREFSFSDMDETLTPLLREFGKPSTRPQPELPFWHLQTDGLWELEQAGSRIVAEPSQFPGRRALRDEGYIGGLPATVFAVLEKDPAFRREIAGEILSRHFPDTLHQDVLNAIGLSIEIEAASTRRRRDPAFRLKVIRAYERRCAVCGFGVWLDDRPVGLEAAHIKWHQAGGPDSEPNGLAMCALHHKLFDRGVFSLAFDRTVLVSELAHGDDGLQSWLLQHHGQPLRKPVRSEFTPGERYIGWHQKQVFRGPAREVA